MTADKRERRKDRQQFIRYHSREWYSHGASRKQSRFFARVLWDRALKAERRSFQEKYSHA